MQIGDVQEDTEQGLVTLAKTRAADSKNIALLKLDARRHWHLIKDIRKSDRPFVDKVSKIVWRGSCTGTRRLSFQERPRVKLLARWALSEDSRVDVGLGKNSKGAVALRDGFSSDWIKDGHPPSWFLQYKYILSVEGNDKDSGLQWKLASNSVVFMVKPFFESWLREFQLQPYVHYVPIESDFSDLLEKFAWCEEHPDLCEQIAKNATEYVLNIANDPEEFKRQAKVVQAFYKQHEKLGKGRKILF